MPYALKVLDQELTTFTTTGLRFVTEKTVGRLKDTMLQWKQSGAAMPAVPEATVQVMKEIIPQIEESTDLVADIGPPGFSAETEYAKVGSGRRGNFIIEPVTTEVPNLIPSSKYPLLDANFAAPLVGGSTNIIGKENMHNSINQIVDLKQTGGEAPEDSTPIVGGSADIESIGLDDIPVMQTYDLVGGVAPVDSIGQDTVPVRQDFEPQSGGGAPVSSIGQDPIPVRTTFDPVHYTTGGGKVKSILKKTKFDDDKQVGGMSLLQTEAPMSPVFPGTEIKPEIFSQQQLETEPYVVANPYTSPPLETNLPKLEAVVPGHIPVSATLTQPVQMAEDITNTIKVFENADIRVIKLA